MRHFLNCNSLSAPKNKKKERHDYRSMISPAGMCSANVAVWPRGPLELRFNGVKDNNPFTQRLPVSYWQHADWR